MGFVGNGGFWDKNWDLFEKMGILLGKMGVLLGKMGILVGFLMESRESGRILGGKLGNFGKISERLGFLGGCGGEMRNFEDKIVIFIRNTVGILLGKMGILGKI